MGKEVEAQKKTERKENNIVCVIVTGSSSSSSSPSQLNETFCQLVSLSGAVVKIE